jgi:hypothetical protein
MIVTEYLDYVQSDYSCVTYEMYCDALDLVMNNQLTEGFFDGIRQMALPRELLRVFQELKFALSSIASEFRMGLPDLVSSFKQRDVFGVLRSFGFNIRLMFRALVSFTTAVRSGLLEVFRELYKTRAIQKLRAGVIKIDELLDKYPILKKVTGIVIAGLLLYIWLNMTFIGDLDYDFNFSDITAALGGTFSLANLFISPEGLMLLSLFGTGAAFGLSIPWLGKTVYNLVLALVYTAYYKYKGNDRKYRETINKMKKRMRGEKLK